MNKILNKLIEEVKNTYKENLVSIILYGSKASEEDSKKYSDYNLLIIFENLKFEDLKLMHKLMKKWIKYNPPPLLFTIDELKKSTDVFPIEFLDIKEHHKVLYGKDPFEELEILDSNIRHECEAELKGKLLKLKQGYIMTGGNKKRIKDIMIHSISTFLIIFRHIIRLFGEVPPKKRVDALNILSEKLGINKEPFLHILDMRNQKRDILKLDPENVMKEYIKEIEKVVDFIDNLE
jgi:predicted nucleotidyltransferase